MVANSPASPMTVATIIAAVAGVLFTIGGTCGQLVSLNFWLGAFPSGAGPFTVLTLVATTLALLFFSGLAAWVVFRRPKLRFAVCPESIFLLFLCGACYAFNGVLIVFATPQTPELLQAMLFSTGIVWTFVSAGVAEIARTGLESFRVMDRRAALVPVSFLLCAAGLIVGAGSLSFTHMSSEAKKWTILFALAQIPGGIFNVLTGHYMSRFSQAVTVSITPGVVTSQSFQSNDLRHHHLRTSDPTTVKLVMLFGSALFQALGLFCLFPLDWTKGYGTSADGADALRNLKENYECVFFSHPRCGSENFAYYVAFTLSYAGSFIGMALLNQISPPMCAMVTQLATPAGALLLIIVPAWNVSGQHYSIASTLVALVLVTAGSMLYVFWARFMQSPEALALAGVDTAEQAILSNPGTDGWMYSNSAN
eukprot:CAMPEP_0174849022 /NCGR_PEP_ID=MMETSP1114-20130205/13857_1 /TAXON_ID=312471 /ORGANISM="Neobodo designis, Strain CCAP 1951/1" /LENGTH=422 /DNA_ID=CAMNT_0016083331 /DNA_START=56 /DNA_END=1321 /DNA_ORIENTATION=-